ncbi:uncharacterized protein LOC128216974 [Mya arenaria]|uniref:uncharacterized protein LOC128216974 n=1 Tax=Mya arenaria TaxID=6604 RepID=UPI0022DF8D62|nr:uncharacterized protein LOC128216974 [Mya arenaria]
MGTAESDRIETKSFMFLYDPETGFFVGYNHLACFVANLTDLEKQDVHTTSGIIALELKMIRDWIGNVPEIHIYADDPMLSIRLQHMCSHLLIYFLDRDTQTGSQTTPVIASAALHVPTTKPFVVTATSPTVVGRSV